MLADEGSASPPELRELRERLVGFRFPDGASVIRSQEAWLGHEAMQVPDDDADELHPLWPLVVGMRGMGTSITDLCELAVMGDSDSVMFGELEISQPEPLIIGTTYTVRGEIRDVVRRTGKRSGTFDVLTFKLTLLTPFGALAATVNNSFVFVRRP